MEAMWRHTFVESDLASRGDGTRNKRYGNGRTSSRVAAMRLRRRSAEGSGGGVDRRP
jgi:hypothetical protein